MADGSLTGFLFQGSAPVPAPTGSDTSSSFPLWLQQSIANAIGAGANLAQQPFTAPPGPQVAAPSATTQRAWQLAGTNTGNWQPALNTASALTQQGASTPLTGGNINGLTSSLMNPFTNYITGALNTNLMQNVLPQVQDRFVGSGQVGSPQDAQLTGQAIYNNQQAIGQALAGQYGQAQNAAIGALNANNALALQGGAQMGQLGALTSQLGAVDVGQLAAAGQAQDTLSQANINAALNNFYQQQQWPYQNLSFLSDIIRGLPVQAAGVNTQSAGTTYTAPYAPSPFSTFLGTAGLANSLGFKKGGHVRSAVNVNRFAEGGLSQTEKKRIAYQVARSLRPGAGALNMARAA